MLSLSCGSGNIWSFYQGSSKSCGSFNFRACNYCWCLRCIMSFPWANFWPQPLDGSMPAHAHVVLLFHLRCALSISRLCPPGLLWWLAGLGTKFDDAWAAFNQVGPGTIFLSLWSSSGRYSVCFSKIWYLQWWRWYHSFTEVFPLFLSLTLPTPPFLLPGIASQISCLYLNPGSGTALGDLNSGGNSNSYRDQVERKQLKRTSEISIQTLLL